MRTSRVLVGGIAAAAVVLGVAFVTGALVGRGPGDTDPVGVSDAVATSQRSMIEAQEPGAPQPPGQEPPGPQLELVRRPDLPGKVVRTLSSLKIFADQSPDPNNDRLLFTDAWVRLDGDGTPVEYVSRITSASGELVQTVQQTTSTLDVRSAVPFGSSCGFFALTPPEALLKTLPPYYDPAAARTKGFEANGATIGTLPLNAATRLPGVIPERTTTTDPGSPALARSTPTGDGGQRVAKIVVSDSGLMLAWQSGTTDAVGGRITETLNPDPPIEA